ncbi:MAG: RdgB/HAM1 family non-canonical purine NTP pyrophosphatase [Xanthomonadales bacterium]|nr:dITP/XTP pyrophosphatase [Xanthomonadales bacterium]MCC6594759.1 RdgB/HAM1 family non-canonical purine NTP pyrophosphatase [Xanthomonadales bacterium]MCE7932821.1 RdgB/HAM1 family non-canonical purine NTP pyrophosphatase [Xanthomonadales bacterium PRO6]
MAEVVLASHNPGKLTELRELLDGLPWQLRSAADFGLGAPEEGAATFVENALAKARYAALATGLPALADDSGLVVDALGGAPGVRSARYAGADADDAANIACLLHEAEGLEGAARSCHFVCVIVLLRSAHDPMPLIAQGIWHGRLLRLPRGKGGFGYDPVFLDASRGRSAAELTTQQKHAISHRGQALAQLRAQLSVRGVFSGL